MPTSLSNHGQSSMSIGHTTAREFLVLVSDSPGVRRKRFLKLMLVLCVPMAALFFQCGIIMSAALSAKAIAKSTAAAVAASVQIGDVVTRLQRERGMTSLFLSSKNSNVTWNNLIKLRASTEQGITAVSLWPGKPKDVQWLITSDNFREHLLRHRIERSSNHTAIEEVIWYTRLIEGALQLVNRDVRLSGDIGGELWKNLFALELFTNTKEAFGIQRALGSAYFSKGYSIPAEQDLFFDVYVKSRTFFEICFDHSQRSKELYTQIMNGRENLTSLLFVKLRPIVLANLRQEADVAGGLSWFGNMSTYIDLLSALEGDLITTVNIALDYQITTAENEFLAALALLIVAVIVCPPLCAWYVYSVNNINKFIGRSAKQLAKQTTEISVEKKKGEGLLHRMLPPSIADALKRGEAISAEHYDTVTVYFSDIVGFTKISAKSTPMQVVEMLNTLYSLFDEELDAHDVYKVETIGDAYMVCSGLPRRNKDQHAVEIADLSLNFLQFIYDFKIKHLPSDHLKLRVGLHTGPVLTGVVGTKMPRYCLFGPTVTQAARMEQSGIAQRIHVSKTCRDLLTKLGGFDLIVREKDDFTNSGESDLTYWLMGKVGSKFKADGVMRTTP